MRRNVLSAVVVLVVAVLIGACGGGAEATTPTEPRSEPAGANGKRPEPAENAEESIEGYGEEAEGATRAEVLTAYRSYLDALSQRDYAEVCALLSSVPRKTLQHLTSGAGPRLTCPKALPFLLSPDASRIAAQQAEGEVKRVRVEEDRAFVVFHAPGARLFQFTLVREDDEWKLAGLTAGVLAP